MINITIDCATGAEARAQLMALLGATDGPFEQIAIKDEKIAENFEAPKTETQNEEKPAEKVKRRTKAEIEAEKNAAPSAEVQEKLDEKVADDVQESVKEEAKVASVTKEMLQEKAVNLIRNSKKEQVVAVLKKFGADSIAQAEKNPLKVEDYPAVMDELNKL